jgi:predicted house-cleaning noncanonical NTP pyrophosphatase (MazG superfamily)
MAKYKTNNLDLAAYLLTLGFEPKIAHKSMVFAEFVFDEEALKHVPYFLEGSAKVNLAHYLYTRTYLKTLNRRLGGSEVAEVAQDKNDEFLGRTYFYIDDGQVYHSVFGKAPIHAERRENGNYYKTKGLANMALRTMHK